MNLKLLCECSFNYLSGGKVVVTFYNGLTGEKFKREYKNFSIASAQATKFNNRLMKEHSNG